ncbi:MAG: peptidoglycan DD-metalloendopeptidase family protein [Prevotellaceae bacterium]|jgi:murein DD-endopeptidase MepM/ murein hydrolase activator NlpD|nr:peptidoglycan DD-metalloendopeptidase family protein [Prevotellaceae bacterium]
MIRIFYRTVLLVVAVFVCCANTSAQDLIARQAPVDRKLVSIDSLALLHQQPAEQPVSAVDIYPTWDNERVQAYANVLVPDSYKFDLTGFTMPTTNMKVNDIFGYRPRRRRMHYGLDIKVAIGDTIRAAFDGKVRIVKNQGRRRGYGKYIVIRHDNGLETVYGHLSKQIVTENQEVKSGDPIGLGGNTGRSTGSHLHFETRFLGIPLDPALMFDFPRQDIVADNYTFTKVQNRGKTAGSYATGTDLYYRVKKGDNLSRIAARQGISVSKLCQLNGITTKTILRPGQVLRCS